MLLGVRMDPREEGQLQRKPFPRTVLGRLGLTIWATACPGWVTAGRSVVQVVPVDGDPGQAASCAAPSHGRASAATPLLMLTAW